ncbi:MAG: hypothetical protein LQ341_001246 [Variospora aurantia]|nr:MAG: hypothetical protein LQ341_001246 [Variospora aurantia]
MVLTHTPRKPHNPDSFPTTQLFILAICRLAEPVALASCFPYAWVMVRDFNVGDENNASFFAGIFISAFAFSESLTGMFWGGFSDRVGRKPVLLLGCAGTMLSLLIVGLSTNFWVALAGRVVGGLLNGNIGVIQTMVGELVTKPEHEPRAYAVMPFVWSIGTIIGPAIGGVTARPAVTMPEVFSASGVFGKFPFLLPNLICSALLLVSICMGYFFLIETHPDIQPWSTPEDYENTTAETPLMVTSGAIADAGVDLRQDSYGTFNEVNISEEKRWNVNTDGSPRAPSINSTTSDTIFTRRVVMLIVALGIFTYHSMTYDHLLPIFLQDRPRHHQYDTASGPFHVPGGLGLTTQAVGIIMSINGVIALVIQAIVFPLFAAWFGVWKVLILVTVLHPIEYFIVPYLATLPENLVYTGIWVCLTIRNFTSILAYPVLLILLKEASPSPNVLGKINGLAASAGAACRTIAPPIAGLLYGIGARQGFTGLAWWGSGIVAIVGAIQVFWIDREKNKTAHVRSMAPCLAPIQPEHREGDVVRIFVTDVNETQSHGITLTADV